MSEKVKKLVRSEKRYTRLTPEDDKAFRQRCLNLNISHPDGVELAIRKWIASPAAPQNADAQNPATASDLPPEMRGLIGDVLDVFQSSDDTDLSFALVIRNYLGYRKRKSEKNL